MAKTASAMIPLGTEAPSFLLVDVVSEKLVRLEDNRGDVATVIFFMCNHCPYVKHVIDGLITLALDYQDKGVSFIAINANDVTQYPDDSPQHMKKWAIEKAFPFVYLFDETQAVAMAYQAQCTPDFYVYDNHLKLAYRGQLDDARPSNAIPVTGYSIRTALDCLLMKKPISEEQQPSLGCGIKWKDK